MRCYKQYLHPGGVMFESWIGSPDGDMDCKIKAGHSFYFVRVTSYRGDRGVLNFKGSTAYAGSPKHLHFRYEMLTDSPEWILINRLISSFGGFTEKAEIVLKDQMGSTDTVLAIIENCDYKDFIIPNKQLDLDVDL